MRDQDLPATFVVADEVSTRGQFRTKCLVRTELTSLLVASIAGVSTLRLGEDEVDVLAIVSILSFVVAISAMGIRAVTQPERQWYLGRAVAESVRTLSWKYVMRAGPFADLPPEVEPPLVLLERIERIGDVIDDSWIRPPNPHSAEVSSGMTNLMSAPLSERRAAYCSSRISSQVHWYSTRSSRHGGLSRTWTAVAVVASALGVVAGFGKLILFDADLLGFFAAVATSSLAWNQLNQNRNLSIAYAVTARELMIIRDRLESVPDADWSKFVEEAEEAISREHTLWLARRGQVV